MSHPEGIHFTSDNRCNQLQPPETETVSLSNFVPQISFSYDFINEAGLICCRENFSMEPVGKIIG